METKNTCPSSKRRFESETDAQYAARDGMLLRDAPQLATYFCLTCLGHHLTSSIKEPKVKKNSKRRK
jgi:hypothetical protein